MKIEPSGDGTSATITLDWQEPFRISDDNPLTSARVDIGVFANNGVHDSAPAILSWYFPPEEARTLRPRPRRDAAHREHRLYRPARRLRRPDADPAGELARRLPLRPGRERSPAGPASAATGRTNTTRRASASSSRPAAIPPPPIEAVAYPLTRLPDGGLGIEETSALR